MDAFELGDIVLLLGLLGLAPVDKTHQEIAMNLALEFEVVIFKGHRTTRP